jgi:hypothetical protein
MRAFAVILTVGVLLLGVAAPIVLCAVFALAAPLLAVVVPRGAVRRCAEQPVALRALVLFRGPPSLA